MKVHILIWTKKLDKCAKKAEHDKKREPCLNAFPP